jgi:signal transduction histidine kinase
MDATPALSAADRAERAGVIATDILDRRPHRAPDFAAESSSMHRLARELTAQGGDVLQTLAQIAMDLCAAGSAGISLFEQGGDNRRILRWVGISGLCTRCVGTVVPIDDSPSGVALELGAAQLLSFPKHHFACLSIVTPEVVEELIIPIPGEPEPWGALWVMSHDEKHLFDAEDRRLLTSLANFTCAALTMSRAKSNADARVTEAEAARNALALAEAQKDDFIATLSHELRNPLGPIDSALTAARKLAIDNPSILSALGIADRQMRLLKRLVGDLLDASRIRHGKLAVHPAYGLLQDIVADAVTAMNADVGNAQHRLRITVPSYPVSVWADAARLTQVVCNLLANAIKYTPAGGNITLSVEAPDLSIDGSASNLSLSVAVITIEDNGAGISSSLLPHVFDMFAQSPSARKHAEGGLGIGLAVVRHLVEAHSGTVSVTSPGEGLGTQVTLRLPIVSANAEEPTASTNATSKIVPMRILLVDDSADATEALGTLLELEGHEVMRAHSGHDALRIVEAFAPHLALIDVSMPGMDGLELAQLLRLRPQCSLTKLIALTGHTDDATGRTTDGRVFDYHFVKPLSLEDLADVLRES